MAKIKVDFTDFLSVLKHEGTGELRATCAKALGGSGTKILTEWDNILRGLEEITQKMAVGAEVSVIVGPIKSISKSAFALSSMASQALSFIPGPIGMVCSAINAIVCFCTLPFPANLCQGFLELLGCIPGGKFAGKLAPQMEKIIVRMIEKGGLKDLLKSNGSKKLMDFIGKNFKHADDMPTPPRIQPKTNGVGNYSQINRPNTYSLGEVIQHNQKVSHGIKTPGAIKDGYSESYNLNRWYTMGGSRMNPLPKLY